MKYVGSIYVNMQSAKADSESASEPVCLHNAVHGFRGITVLTFDWNGTTSGRSFQLSAFNAYATPLMLN